MLLNRKTIISRKFENQIEAKCPSFCYLVMQFSLVKCVRVLRWVFVTWGSDPRFNTLWFIAFPTVRIWTALVIDLDSDLFFFFFAMDQWITVVFTYTGFLGCPLPVFSYWEQSQCLPLAFLKLKNPHSLQKSPRCEFVTIQWICRKPDYLQSSWHVYTKMILWKFSLIQ